MHLSLRQLEIFAAVADHGTTTAAGSAIALSQSAISSALAELERSFDGRLFDRVGKRLRLNEAGRALLPEARALLDGARTIERGFGIGSRASDVRPPIRLRLGASTTIGNYLLPALIARFCADQADAEVHVSIGNTGDVAAAVERFDVDLGFVEGPCDARELTVHPWLDDELVVVCAALHPLALQARDGRVSLAQLRTASWLLREPGSGTRAAVEQALLPSLHALHGRLSFGSTEAIKQATAAGLGLTCLSRHAVEDLVSLGRLVVLRTTLKTLRRRFHVVHHRRKRLSSGLERFVRHCFEDG